MPLAPFPTAMALITSTPEASAWSRACGTPAVLFPGGVEAGGSFFHIKLPGTFDPIDEEPSTITDFNGALAFATLSGMGTRTQLSTETSVQLPFGVDLRFMKGVFVGTDGKVHKGTFAYV